MSEQDDSERHETSTRARSIQTLEQATTYLEGLINRERSLDYRYERLDLKPILALLEGIGRPDRALSVVHVAGSKGKGSTCLFVEAILRELGEHVGVFTSPHLESWTERFRIDGEPVAPDELVAAVERVRPIVESLRTGPLETRPSFFDATTAVAFLLFAEAEVDRAIIEVGLGGRLDSTNVVSPTVTCVTSIELEHTDKLGDTEGEIAAEKAGILKPGIPAVIGALRTEASAVVLRRAAEVAAPTSVLGRDFRCVPVEAEGAGRVAFELDGVARFETRLAARGEAARQNAALAVECVRMLAAHPEAALFEAAPRALASCSLPARIEVLANDPRVIVDAAHTTESARALARALEELAPEGYDLLLSISSDKNLDALLEALLPRSLRVWSTRAEPTRSLPADELALRVERKARDLGLAIAVEVDPDPESASRRARAALPSGARLCAAGSVYLAGIARRILSQAAAAEHPERTR